DKQRPRVVWEVQATRELLRDRRRPGALRPERRDGARDGDRVDARMREETLILCRDRRLQHPWRDLAESHGNAEARASVALEHGAVRVDDDGAGEDEPGLRSVERREPRIRRQDD